MDIAVGTDTPPARRQARRLFRRTVWIVTTCLVVVFGAVTARLFVWPDLPPLPAQADAVIELAGPDINGREQLATDLVLAHRAPVLIQSTVPEDPSCGPPAPGVRIECFVPDPRSTRGEARYIGRLAAQRHWTSVILVTTPDQAWRARLRVSRCFDGQIYNSTVGLPFGMWFRQIPYQWAASIKAVAVERDC